MIKILNCFLLHLTVFCCYSQKQSDSLYFIEEVKKFVYQEAGYKLAGDFYSKWVVKESPYIYVYVSLPHRVEKPTECKNSFIFCNNDTVEAKNIEKKYTETGYQVFIYKTFANASAVLNNRFLSYADEAKAFIIFHEYTHNYITENKLSVPYEFNEALCDVLGNYGPVKYNHSTNKLNAQSVKNQLVINEKIYRCLNKTIEDINDTPQSTLKIHNRCEKKVKRYLKNANLFQKDRFNFSINNAYLLKNQFYCKNYFLLKEVFLKQKSVKDFLLIMKKLPDKTSECEKYLKAFK